MAGMAAAGDGIGGGGGVAAAPCDLSFTVLCCRRLFQQMALIQGSELAPNLISFDPWLNWRGLLAEISDPPRSSIAAVPQKPATTPQRTRRRVQQVLNAMIELLEACHDHFRGLAATRVAANRALEAALKLLAAADTDPAAEPRRARCPVACCFRPQLRPAGGPKHPPLLWLQRCDDDMPALDTARAAAVRRGPQSNQPWRRRRRRRRRPQHWGCWRTLERFQRGASRHPG